METETIAALATPPGRGGIAIVRVSGPHVKAIMQTMLRRELPPRQATYLPFCNQAGDPIDEGITIFFPHPHSFTGEDVLEFHGHGGPVVADLLLQTILCLGARLARAGEFSERAFLNGKMDLTQAEAVADLINASSTQAAQSALRSLQGEFSKAINTLNEKIIRMRMYVEATIDFSDEDIDFLGDKNVLHHLTLIIQDLEAIQNNAKQGSLLREGITVVIAGEPNVGKSSLLNCLSGKELAIVTDIPGTTRDVLRHHILLDGMPMHIIDTAGLRDSKDVVEQEGIRRAYQEIKLADIILYVTEVRNEMPEEQVIIRMNSEASVIYIRNKIDLLHEPGKWQEKNGNSIISLSAKSGEGIELLKRCIKEKVGFHGESHGIYLARRRHLDALSRAYLHVQHSIEQLTHSRASELMAEDLRLAHLALCEITGEFTADDLLGQIFATFCIGK